MVLVNGVSLFTVGEAIEAEFIDFFLKLFTKDDDSQFLPTNNDWCPIIVDLSTGLEVIFTKFSK